MGESVVHVPTCSPRINATAVPPLDSVLGLLSAVGGDSGRCGFLGRKSGDLLSVERQSDAISFQSGLRTEEEGA